MKCNWVYNILYIYIWFFSWCLFKTFLSSDIRIWIWQPYQTAFGQAKACKTIIWHDGIQIPGKWRPGFFRSMYVFFCVRDVKERKMFKTFNISRLFFVCAFQRFIQIPFIKCWRLLSKKTKRSSNQCHPLEWNLMASAGVPVMRMDLTWSLEIRLPELVRLKRNKLKQTTLSNLKRRETTKHDAHYVTIYILSIQTYVFFTVSKHVLWIWLTWYVYYIHNILVYKFKVC